MSDFLSDGYSLNDYVSDGQLFYKPTDKIRFEGALSALCDSHRHVMIVTDDTKLAERYYRYFITRIAIRKDIALDTRAATRADDVLNRFNKILSNAPIESARSDDKSYFKHVMAMADTSNMSNNEWGVLGRLLKNFPGANIRMLAFLSEDQLEVVDEVLGKLDGQVYRWILTSPTAEYLEALLDIGEQFNYEAETRAMVSALGYESKRFRKQTEEDPMDALDEINLHLSGLATEQPNGQTSARAEHGDEPSKPGSNDDFDNDLKALLGAVRNSSADQASENTRTHESNGLENKLKVPITDNNAEGSVPPRPLIWATGITGVALIALAIVAPWESTEPDAPRQATTISSRVFVEGTRPQDSVNESILKVSSANEVANKAQPKARAKADNAEIEINTQVITQAMIGIRPELSTETLELETLAVTETGFAAGGPEIEAKLNAQSNSDLTVEQAEMAVQSRSESEPKITVQEPVAEVQATAEPEPEITPDVPEVAITPAATSDFELAVTEPQFETRPAAELESELTTEKIKIGTQSIITSGLELTTEELEVETEPVSEAPRDRINKAEPRSFFIQLGVYANRAQAQALVDDLAASEPVFFLPLQKGSRVLQTVVSGPYPDRDTAEQAARTRFSSSDTWVRSINAIRKELID